MSDSPFNPLDKSHLAESLAEAMLKRPACLVPPPERFEGAGIYALYYAGDFKSYEPIAKENRGKDPMSPIYIGKAVPPGARKGGFGLGADPGAALLKRLTEHAKSINEVENLDLKDFSCRYLVCDDIWIPLGEALLIERFQPPWNVLVTGFGIHTPGKGRKNQVKSRWDTLHPGRMLASDLPANPQSEDQILSLLADLLARKPVSVLTPTEAIIEEEEEGED